MERAAFRFDNYYFTKASIQFSTKFEDNLNLNITFKPKGEFCKDNSLFKLYLSVIISYNTENSENKIIEVDCYSEFVFSEKIKLSEIPYFFYPNSIAILFPYIRAFVSTLTLQANINPIVLPTMNLTSLQEDLKNNTIEI
jgi:Preprotein translocase subunit SecB.